MNRKWKRIFILALFGCVGLIVSGVVVDAATRQEMLKYLTLLDPRGDVTNPQFIFTLWGPHYFTVQLTGTLEKGGHWIIKVGGVESINEDFPGGAWLLQVTYHIRVDSVLTLDILTTGVIQDCELQVFSDVPPALENVYLWYARTAIPIGIVGVFIVISFWCTVWYEERKEKKLGWHTEPAAASSPDPRH